MVEIENIGKQLILYIQLLSMKKILSEIDQLRNILQ